MARLNRDKMEWLGNLLFVGSAILAAPGRVEKKKKKRWVVSKVIKRDIVG